VLFNFKYFKEIYYAFGILFIVLFSGTLGFILVEGYNLPEALYMTIITVSTVGFQEVRPLSEGGRIFTSMLIISSFGTFAYAITSISRYIVTGDYKNYFKNYKVDQEVKKIKNHVIICGYGRNGTQAVKTLKAHKKNFIIIEKDPSLIEELLNEKFPYIEGDATDENVMIKAGIKSAQALITTLPNDALNVFVVLTARELNQKVTIISRASESSSESKMRIAGADNVIMPDRVGGAHMASLVVTPDVMEFIDKISISGEDKINLEEILISDFPIDTRRKTIMELESKYHTGCRIIGVKDEVGEYIINPSPDYKLKEKIKLFVLGTQEQIQSLNKALGKK
jgi:voltage-gated potassium channel